MTRTHRIVHRLIWPALALAVGVGFITALVLRPPPPAENPTAANEQQQ